MIEYIPFDMRIYAKRPELKVVTEDRTPAKIHFWGDGVFVTCENKDGSERLYMFDTNTVFADFSGLYFKVDVRRGWMNVCRYGDNRNSTVVGNVIFPTREEALKARSESCVDTIKITWIE